MELIPIKSTLEWYWVKDCTEHFPYGTANRCENTLNVQGITVKSITSVYSHLFVSYLIYTQMSKLSLFQMLCRYRVLPKHRCRSRRINVDRTRSHSMNPRVEIENVAWWLSARWLYFQNQKILTFNSRAYIAGLISQWKTPVCRKWPVKNLIW